MQNRKQWAAVAAAAMCLIAAPLSAQKSAQPRAPQPTQRLTGLMIGVHTVAAPGVAINGEDVRDDFHTTMGGGIGAMVGYGFTEALSAYASLDLARQGSGMSDLQGSFGLAHFEIGARANLPIGSQRTIPFVSLAVGRRALGAHITDEVNDEEYDASFSGGMVAVGGGVQRALSPTTTLEGGIEFGVGTFGKLSIDGDEDSVEVESSRSLRLRFGLVWRP